MKARYRLSVTRAEKRVLGRILAGRTPTPRAPSRSGACDPDYAGACVPIGPPDVDCPQVGAPVQVVGQDPHRLDGDGDGLACQGEG